MFTHYKPSTQDVKIILSMVGKGLALNGEYYKLKIIPIFHIE
jgi:hypothetical protein